MRKLLCIVFLIVFSVGCLAEADDEIVDDYDLYYEEAIPIEESKFFEIGYRVCAVPEELQETEGARSIQYDLVLTNMSDNKMRNLRFTAHMKKPLQAVLVVANWYNEPMTLYPLGDENGPSTVIYSWSPVVVLDDLAFCGELELEDFYEMLLEITWNGGREVVRLNSSAVNLPQAVGNALEERVPLDETELDNMYGR